jgi:hypothetical protein
MPATDLFAGIFLLPSDPRLTRSSLQPALCGPLVWVHRFESGHHLQTRPYSQNARGLVNRSVADGFLVTTAYIWKFQFKVTEQLSSSRDENE